MTTEFTTLDVFYNDRPERRTSPESDYGVHWHAGACTWPTWRVSYIQATGEIYAVQQLPHGLVRVLGVVPADPDERDWNDYRTDGKTYYRTLDKILDGWADPDVTSHDLAWIERKLAAAASAPAALDLRPGPHEVAVAFVPPGVALTLHGDPLVPAEPECVCYVTVPGTDMGWGAKICRYGGPAGIRNGRHMRDRSIWHLAAAHIVRASRSGDAAVVYVVHEMHSWHGKPVLHACRLRNEADQ